MRSLELKVPPVPLAIAFAGAMLGAAFLFPAATFTVAGRVGIAVALAVGSVSLVLSGVAAFRKHKTTLNPLKPSASSTVVSSGIYRHTRNPMYLGLLIVLVAWAVYLSNAIAALFLPAFVVYMNRFQIEPEERALRSKFGSAFERYAAAVRRWV